MHPALLLVLSALASAMSAQQSAPLSQCLERLKALPPLEQIRELQELSAAGPVGRSLASAVVKPELIGLRRGELEFRLGPEPVQGIAALAVGLQVEARGDERVMVGLEALARQIAAQGPFSPLDFGGAWYDGSAAPGTRLGRATTWPIGDPAGYKQRVHTITSQDGQVLINGKPAAHFREKRAEGGLVSELFVHPDDPGLLVKVYHSPGSLEAFERKYSKIESLGPLSMAGATPKMIEHGEIPVSGQGRVYFYVQELINGSKLEDLAPKDRKLDEIKKLFERMAAAGLSLVVPGSDQSWLLSHIVQAKTPGGAHAYVLGALVEPGEPAELAAHYEMLLSVLSSGPAAKRRAAGGAAEVPAAKISLQSNKLAAVEGAADTKKLVVSAAGKDALAAILKRHKLDGVATEAAALPTEIVLRFDSERGVANAAATLLLDFDVAQVKVDAAMLDYIERQSAKALYDMLRLLPESPDRDALIMKIPAAAYGKTEGADVAAILSLVGKNSAGYAKVPREAWQRMAREDAARLVKQWLAVDHQTVAKTAAELWLAARYADPLGAPGDAGADVAELLRLMPERLATEALSAAWPAVGSRIAGPQRQDLLKLLPEEMRVSPRVRDLFKFGLEPNAQLDAIGKLLDAPEPLSVYDLIHLLQNMPRGQNWGWHGDSNGAPAKFYERMKELGVEEEWDPTGFVYMDVPLAAKAIRKTQTTAVDSDELAKVPELARDVLAMSKEASSGGADHRTRLETYLFEEIRRLGTPGQAPIVDSGVDGKKGASQDDASRNKISPNLTLIFNSELKPEAQLDAIEKLIEGSKPLNARELLYLLERMPRGVSWGWSKPKDVATKLFNRMKALGIQNNWATGDFLYMDVVLTAKAIERTSARVDDAALLAQVPKLVKKILDASQELKDKKEDYVVNVQSLMFEELRQLNNRLKPNASNGRGNRYAGPY